jgi:hypothetical protein
MESVIVLGSRVNYNEKRIEPNVVRVPIVRLVATQDISTMNYVTQIISSSLN